LKYLVKKLVIPLVFVPFSENVMEQNSASFLNSMFFHVGPYTSYFGFGYGGIGSVLIMWPPMSDPFVNDTTPLKLTSEVAQVGIVIDHGEPSGEDDDSSKKKCNLKMT
jgi:hypothetical protein